jgi:hypothetical protein
VPLFPDEQLWISLKGGNGVWEKRKAIVEWRIQVVEHQESEAERITELKNARRAKIEADAKKRRDREGLQKRVEEDAILRRQRQEEEEAQKLLQRLEEEEQKRIQAGKKEQMHKPRPCKTCGGSTKCIPCDGKGYCLTTYLSHVVNERTNAICGQLPRGCASCGGSGDGAWWGDFVRGSGGCQSCGAEGLVPAPPNGWPDCQ